MPPAPKSLVERRRSSRQIAKRADVGPACQKQRMVPNRGGGSCAGLTIPKPEVRNVAKRAGDILDAHLHVTDPEAVSV
jgi:hypothetical protein